MSSAVGSGAAQAAGIERNGIQSGTVVGYAAIAVTVAVWAGFALSIRYISASALTTADVALIRFGLPTLLLLPFLPSRRRALRRVKPRDAMMVICGAGLPFFFVASAGGAATSATYVGALIAGTSPLSVALVGYAIDRRFPPATRWYALAIIVAGAAALVVASPAGVSASTAKGVALLLGASLLWGIYTLGLRRAGLDAVGSTLLLNVPSLVGLLALMASGMVDSHLGTFSLAEAAPFLLVQGLGVGLISSLTYVVAIARLGAARSATVGSLAPALASLLAVPLLGEPLTLLVALGVGAITLGVLLSNRS